VRRIPELNKTVEAGQATLFDLFRFHAFCTTSTLSTVDADKTHRQHAVIENLNADMKASGRPRDFGQWALLKLRALLKERPQNDRITTTVQPGYVSCMTAL
jgi:hypothetical protein